MKRLMLLSSVLNSLQGLIDFLSQVSQTLCTNRLDDDPFLIAQGERLPQISVGQSCLRLFEQGLAELIADHCRRKEAMQAIPLARRLLKTK